MLELNDKYTFYILGVVAVMAIIIMTLLVKNDLTNINNTNTDSSGLAMASAKSGINWTSWYNTDSPDGTGDYELLTDIRKSHPNICTEPLAIQCATSDGATYSSTKQKVTCSTNIGVICQNSLNNGSSKKVRCKDYKIRIGCPMNST